MVKERFLGLVEGEFLRHNSQRMFSLIKNEGGDGLRTDAIVGLIMNLAD